MQTATNSAKPSTNHSEANEHKTLGDIVGIKNASSALFNFVGECEERHVWVWLRKHYYALNPNLTKCQYCFLSSCSASQKPKGARYHKNIKKRILLTFIFAWIPELLAECALLERYISHSCKSSVAYANGAYGKHAENMVRTPFSKFGAKSLKVFTIIDPNSIINIYIYMIIYVICYCTKNMQRPLISGGTTYVRGGDSWKVVVATWRSLGILLESWGSLGTISW